MRISDLSGDSSISKLQWKDGVISFQFEDFDLNETFLIEVQSSRFNSETTEEVGSVRLEIIDGKSVIPIHDKSKIYMMPEMFKKQMEINKKGLSVALGLSSIQFPSILIGSGYSIVFSCPIRNENSIKISKI